jgi:hypothetical protein
MFVKAWQLHPKACRIEKAEKTCMGLANKGGIQWCGPYTNANKAGFWLYSPIDMEFTFDGESFQMHSMEDYGPEDYQNVKSLVRDSDQANVEKWCFPGVGRTKTTVGLVEKNVIQIWTGLILETPPGWCLHIRSPINFPRRDIEIMEAVLETDWMQYDIWMNVVCTEGKKTKITKDFPIAQIIPTRRESFKADWSLQRENINRNSPEAEKVFRYWLDYNKQKFEIGGKQALTETLKKDSTTYFREREKMLGRGMEAVKTSGCPFAKMKTLEEDLKDFKESKPKADFFPVFENDKSDSIRKIGEHKGIRN